MMQALRGANASLTKYLPQRSTVVIIALVVAALCVLSFVAVVLLSRASHPFWCTQPVAWQTLLPAAEGRISQTPSQMPQPRDVPNGYTLHTHHAKTLPPASDPLWRTLATLWNTCEHEKEEAEARDSDNDAPQLPTTTHTPRSVHWCCCGGAPSERDAQLHTIRTADDAHRLVATLVTTLTVLDTPKEHDLPVFVVNHVCVHPAHRGKGLVPALIGSAATTAATDSTNAPLPLPPPVGIFATELDFDTSTWHRLPFAEVARTMRVYRTYQPTMLVDPSTEVNHTIVTSLKRLPKRAHESSDARVHGTKRTLEPSATHDARTRHWAHVIGSPYDTLLSVGGDDWVHLHHPPTSDPKHALVFVAGCSFPHAQMVQLPKHVVQWVKRRYDSESSRTKHVTVVAPQPLAQVFVLAEHVSDTADTTETRQQITDKASSEWTYYDAHYVYMYNYRLRQKTTQMPFTMDIDVF